MGTDRSFLSSPFRTHSLAFRGRAAFMSLTYYDGVLSTKRFHNERQKGHLSPPILTEKVTLTNSYNCVLPPTQPSCVLGQWLLECRECCPSSVT